MNDLNISFAYIKSIVLQLEENKTNHPFVYPNPVYEKLNVFIEKENGELALVKIFTLEGKVLLTRHLRIERNQLSLEISNFKIPDGDCLISVQTDTQIATLKIVKR